MPGSRWEQVEISNLKLVSSTGVDVTIPTDAIHNLANRQKTFGLSALGNTLFVTLPRAGYTRVDVFDMHGRFISTLWNGHQQSGLMPLSMKSLRTGLYVVRVVQGKNSAMLRVRAGHI
jgi:hypothetical protein